MRKEFYLNGQLCDSDGISIVLNYACSEIADLSGISGNYSLSIKLPPTANNLLISKFANQPNVSPGTLWPGYKATSSYFVNGVPIFQNAKTKLLSTEGDIQIQVTFGNLDWLEYLDNIKLRDCGFSEMQDWNYWTILDYSSNQVKWILADYGGTFEGDRLHMERMHPAVNCRILWDNIWNLAYGAGIIKSIPTELSVVAQEDLWIPIKDQFFNQFFPVYATLDMKAKVQICLKDYYRGIVYPYSNNNVDLFTVNKGIVFENDLTHGGTTLLGVDDAYFIVPKTGKYRIKADFHYIVNGDLYSANKCETWLNLKSAGESTKSDVNIWYHDGTGLTYDYTDHYYRIEFDKLVDLKKDSVLYLEAYTLIGDQPGGGHRVATWIQHTNGYNNPVLRIEWEPTDNKSEQLEFLMPYDIGYNLPDISCKDFVKAMMQLYGIFANYNNGEIVFFNLNYLTDNMIPNQQRFDWSDKLISFDKPKIEWNLGFKERNWLRYNPDESFNIATSDAYFLTFERDNADKDLFVSIFASTNDEVLTVPDMNSLQVARVPMWELQEKTFDYVYKPGTKQRIFRTHYNAFTYSVYVAYIYGENYNDIVINHSNSFPSWFKLLPGSSWAGKELDMGTILERYYSVFVAMVRSNRLITLEYLLDELDVNKFKHYIPIYERRFPNYYFAKKILNWESGRTSSIELLPLFSTIDVIVRLGIGAVYNYYALESSLVISVGSYDSVNGGWIWYIDEDNDCYYIAASGIPGGLSSIYGQVGTPEGANDDTLGGGYYNTNKCDGAYGPDTFCTDCLSISPGGWYIPNRTEILLIYDNIQSFVAATGASYFPTSLAYIQGINNDIFDFYACMTDEGTIFAKEKNDGLGPGSEIIRVKKISGLNSKSIAAPGWHVSTESEWDTIISDLGGDTVAGGKLKETGDVYWNTPNLASNTSGVGIRGAGKRSTSGSFLDLFDKAYIWLIGAKALELTNDSTGTNKIDLSGSKRQGCSVVLVKDSTDLNDGEQGYYTGNDGKIYRTLCISGLEIINSLLNETKYDDGSDIQVITDGTTWGNLTTGALSYYDNDINNS